MTTSEASGKLLPLVGYVNRKTDEIPFFRKAVYLLVLWYVSSSNIPMEEGPGFTVPKMMMMMAMPSQHKPR